MSLKNLRKRAEARIAETDQKLENLTQEEVAKLVHELHVHQIELEMQNDELHRALDELEESNVRYFELYNLAPIGYCTLNDQGFILEANLTAAELLGIPRNDLIRKSLTTLILPDDQDIYYQYRNRLFESGEPQSCELRVKKGENESFWVRLEATASQDPSGNSIYRVVLSDYSRFKELEKKLQTRNSQLSEINEAKNKFFSILAHDLKSPFNSILGFSEMLKDKAAQMDAAEIKKCSGAVHANALSTFLLLENLLAWGNTLRGSIHYNPSEICLKEVIDEEIDILTGFALKKEISVVSNIPDALNIQADKDMIKVVFRNLLSNAIKFTPKNGIIRIQGVRKDRSIDLSITDSGVGMSEDCQKNLFHKNSSSTTPGTENEKGTGLGLLLCHEFVKKHKGKIAVRSQPGEGTTFRVTLPEG